MIRVGLGHVYRNLEQYLCALLMVLMVFCLGAKRNPTQGAVPETGLRIRLTPSKPTYRTAAGIRHHDPMSLARHQGQVP